MPTITHIAPPQGLPTVDAPANSQPKGTKTVSFVAKDTSSDTSKAPQSDSLAVEAPAPKVDLKDERIEQLAARERALQAQSRAFKAERDAFLAEKNKAPQGRMFDKAAFLADPTAFDLTPDELSQATLGQLNQSPEALRIKQLEAKLAALEDGQKKTLESVKGSQDQAYQNAVKQISHEVKSLVDTNDAFEAIRHENAIQDVVKHIEDEYKATGIVLRVEEAAKQIEDALRKQILGYTKLSFLAAKQEAPADASPAVPAQTRPPTLTHALSQASRTPGRMTNQERIDRAKLAFNGQLK